MKEIPILFSAPMVRALMEGRKTVTRRTRGLGRINEAPYAWEYYGPGIDDFYRFRNQGREIIGIKSPYGVPGDRLWVRETWTPFNFGVECKPSEMNPHEKIVYLADQKVKLDGDRYYPSIHMPRCFSRLTLEVVSVRPERLHDITEEEAKSEGSMFHDGMGVGHSGWRHDYGNVYATARGSFVALWETINGPGSWAKNPYVWRVEFKIL